MKPEERIFERQRAMTNPGTRSSGATWNRPATRSAWFRHASQRSSECGLLLQAANTQECALRNGRYWLIDRELGVRQLSARNLVEVLNFCAHRAHQGNHNEHPIR